MSDNTLKEASAKVDAAARFFEEINGALDQLPDDEIDAVKIGAICSVAGNILITMPCSCCALFTMLGVLLRAGIRPHTAADLQEQEGSGHAIH